MSAKEPKYPFIQGATDEALRRTRHRRPAVHRRQRRYRLTVMPVAA
jgi:hypothetical protein